MSQIIPFESASNLPAHIASIFQVSDDLSSGVGGGFPSLSIKGKVFHIVRGDDRTLVTNKDDPDEPATSLEVVIVKANAAISKVYYTGGYTEGSDAKPQCYSNDGIKPAADSEEPQSNSCATCAHNQWGSRITDNNGQAKACNDSRRIAVAPVGQINDPMLIRVPAASLKPLAQYNDLLKKRGVPYQAVVTKIGFDHSVAHPALTFKPVGFIDDTTAQQVADTASSDVVKNILGLGAVRGASSPAQEGQMITKAAPKPATKPAAAAAPAQEVAQETAKPAAKPAATVIEVGNMTEMLSQLDGMLDD